MVSLMIIFVVHPICTQDAIFKMSTVSPETFKFEELVHLILEILR